ncbi:MAG: TonB-dependent receptor plug domain-containing protein, partial [Verrucomicrobiota bacterium]
MKQPCLPVFATLTLPLRRLVLFFAALAACASLLSAAAAPTRPFALPPGSAAQTLKQFAEQSGRAVAFASATVESVQTRAVQGELAPAEALRQMLAGTPLVAEEDTKTGAFAVRKGPSDPNAPRAGPTPVLRPNASASRNPEDPLLMSPFEVVSENKGYYASNTMSGTRLNSKLEDLAASISVVTKEQMEDFALLDINDIFSMEANTEGTGNFTDFSFNLSGNPVDNVQANPQGANRIRGLGNANMTLGNFETSGRVPVDPVNIDSVEISRGPNSSIFGIGNPSGTVNSVPASASLTKNFAQTQLRAAITRSVTAARP